jgi:hypothetical protein
VIRCGMHEPTMPVKRLTARMAGWRTPEGFVPPRTLKSSS